MTTTRSARAIKWAMTIMGTALAVLGPASPASAHGGSHSVSDYRVEIVGFDGELDGAEIRTIDAGERLELRRTTASEVIVVGYEGEPYLKLNADGIFENANSPARYLNQDRYASVEVPASVDADAEPSWTKIDDGAVVRWHDHRSHWMATIPPPEVQADPDVERVIYDANPVELLVDGSPVAALVKVTWVPPPARTFWLFGVSLVGCALCALLSWRTGASRYLAVVASVAALCVHPVGVTWLVIAVVGAISSVAGLVLGRRPLSLGGAAAAVGVGLTRLGVLGHSVTTTRFTIGIERWATAVALAVGAGVLAAALVDALGRRPNPDLHQTLDDSSTIAG
jgi:hypothetical protein